MEENDIKNVLDNFEKDDFVKAKEELQDLIRTARDNYLKGKLGLQKDITKKPDPPAQPAVNPDPKDKGAVKK
jgi:hypothetical protein